MLQRWSHYVVNQAVWVVAVVLLITALAAAQLVDWQTRSLQLQIDPAIQQLLPAEDEGMQFLNDVEQRFGRTQSIVAAIYTPDIFAPEQLQAIAAVTARLEALPEVSAVLSLASAPLLSADGDDISMATATESRSAATSEESAPQAIADAGALQSAVRANPLYEDTLLSEQGDATALVISLEPEYEAQRDATTLIAVVRDLISEQMGASASVHLAGPPVLKAATGSALRHELTRLLPTIFVLIAAFLVFGFRSARAVILPMLTLAIALVWVMGLVAVSGRSLNLITAIVPPVVLTIGLAYALHLLSAVFRARDDSAHDEIQAALADVALPLLMTGATTSAGFIALMLSPLPSIRDFAWLSASGVGFAVVLSLTFLPAALTLSGCNQLAPPPGRTFFRRLAIRLAHFDLRYRTAILTAGGLLMATSIVGMLNITVGTDYVRGFAEDTPVRVDFERINTDFGGATPLSVVLESPAEDTFAEPKTLRAVAEFQTWLQAEPDVGSVSSVVDYIKVLNRALNGGDEDYFAIPDTRQGIKQMLLFGSGDTLDGLADGALQTLNIVVRTRASGSTEVAALVQRIEQRMRELPEPIAGRVTGTPVLVSNAVDEIAGGQVITIGAALVVVFLLLSALFTSFRVGALAILPNLLPILLYFGALGFAGISLNPTTSLVACIVLGIAVDDTLYYFARFNADAQRFASERKATASALRTVIRPVTYSSAALVLGFLVLTASGLENQVQFGALAAFTIAVAWLADITFTPALASGVRIVTLWDVLRLDLGHAPQKSIPLFADLSLRQARVFALLSNIQQFKKGARVMSQGDEAGDIFVVIDGELRAWVEREDEQVELSSMQRGAVLGEVGHFAKRRSANVDAVTDVRLLRFDNDDLEHLRKRSPRIAALVLRNLNRVQAERLAQTTQMLR